MELFSAIIERRSTRDFTDKMPPKNEVLQIAEAGLWAPSGRGKFLWSITVVYSAEKTLQLAKAVSEALGRGEDYCFYHAPVHIIVGYQRDERHAVADGSAAIENILLSATAFGLGSCWINQLSDCCDAPEVRALLREYGVPDEHQVIGSVAIGYIKQRTAMQERPLGIIRVTE